MSGASTHEVILPLFAIPTPVEAHQQYATLVADPPWRYDSKLAGLRGATDYPTMTREELMMLPVGAWAMPNAHLYLWTTDAFMEDAHAIARAWGFKVQNILVWVKGRDEDRTQMGVGFYYRHTTEYALFCVRGSLPVMHHGTPNVFFAPRRGHSEKPDAFYDLVEHMSPGPRIDIFSRRQRMGWSVWGNEAYNPDALLETLTTEQRHGLVGGGM